MKQKVLSVGEAAQQLKTPYHRVIRMIKRGQLPNSYKVGWGWVIYERDLNRKTWKHTIKKLIPKKKTVELVSKDFFFTPSKKLKKAING